MGKYSTEVNMEFGTTLRFKKEFKYGILTFPKGEEVRVANYVHKGYVQLHHNRVIDLIKINIDMIDDLLEETDVNEDRKKIIHMLNGGQLKSNRDDLAFWDKKEREFVINFSSCINERPYERLYFRYLHTFKII